MGLPHILNGRNVPPKRTNDLAVDISSSYIKLGKFDEAREFLEISLQERIETKDKEGEAQILHQMGILYQEMGQLVKAKESFEKSLEIKTKLGGRISKSSVARTLHQLGMLAQDLGDLVTARAMLEQSLEIKKKVDDQPGIASTYHQLGALATKKNDFDEARILFNKSIELNERLGNSIGKAISLAQLSLLEEKTGNYQTALEYASAAKQIFSIANHPYEETVNRQLEAIKTKL